VGRRVNAEDGVQELAQLWLAPTADALHRVLVMHQPIHGCSDAFEPFPLLQKHHETEPATSVVTAMLLLTDRRWWDPADGARRRQHGEAGTGAGSGSSFAVSPSRASWTGSTSICWPGRS
jgi:hypothetical protein